MCFLFEDKVVPSAFVVTKCNTGSQSVSKLEKEIVRRFFVLLYFKCKLAHFFSSYDFLLFEELH